MSRHSGLSQSEVIKRFTLQFLVPPSIYRALRDLRRRKGTSAGILNYLSADFVQQEAVRARIQDFTRRQNFLPHSAREAHLAELASGTVPLSLELLDIVASRCNIEIRYPFYDQRLVEFCFAIPADQKLNDGWTCFNFRNSLAGIVPEEIRWRYSKADFRPYFKSGMAKFSGKLLEEMILGRSADLEPYLDAARLGALYQRFMSRIDCTLTEVEILYRAALLSGWLEMNQS